MTGMHEYDLKLKWVHIIKGHGLCQIVEEVVGETKYGLSGWEKEIKMCNVERATPNSISNSLYLDVH